jgi:flagellar biosynthesis protein FlhF
MREVMIPPNNEKGVEMTVAIDNDSSVPMSKEEIGRNALASAEKAKMQRKQVSKGQISPKMIAQEAKKAYLQKNQAAEISTSPNVDMMEIKGMLRKIQEELKYKHADSLSESLSAIYRKMIDNGISESRSLRAVSDISRQNINAGFESADRYLRAILTDGISLGGQFDKTGYCQPIFFSGPTGAGKTSVLIKIAVILKLIHQANVLVVSADTYKVAAVEQLQTFASIAGLNFKAVYTPEELRELIAFENTRDFILIDTTGRSPFRAEQIDLIKEYTQAIDNARVCYVQNANTSSLNMLDSLKAYSILNPNSLVLTKIDEVRSLAGLIDALEEITIPLGYLTTGQQVPDDIEPAEKEILMKLILP